MAAKLTWYMRAAFNILRVSSSNFAARSPLCGGSQDCRKQFIWTWVFGPGGMVASTIRSVNFAQAGWDGEKFRWSFSHVISMA